MQSGDLDTDGIALLSPVDLNGGSIRDASGNDAVLTFTPPGTSGVRVDGVPTTITSVTGPADGTYTVGQTLDFTVHLNRTVTLDPNVAAPSLTITVGSSTVPADYLSGSGSNTFVFRYTVRSGDLAPDGIAVAPSIAGLNFTPPNTAGVRVNGVAPPVTQVSPSPVLSPVVSVPTTFPVSAPAGTPQGTEIKVFDPLTGQNTRTLVPFAGFNGAVSVALTDLTGDGVADIVVGAGAGGGPRVAVFDGATGRMIASFYAFTDGFTGGVTVAAGDVTGDGVPDIVVGAGAGGGPHVKVFDGRTFAQAMSFFAYDPRFTGGVTVAVGDVTGGVKADIVTAAGPGGGPEVKVFRGADLSLAFDFFAYDPRILGGVTVAVGDVNGDGFADILTGAGAGGGPNVKVFDGRIGSLRGSLMAFRSDFAGGVSVAATDADGNGKADIAVGAGPGGGPHVVIFDGETFAQLSSTYAFDPALGGGVFVG